MIKKGLALTPVKFWHFIYREAFKTKLAPLVHIYTDGSISGETMVVLKWDKGFTPKIGQIAANEFGLDFGYD